MDIVSYEIGDKARKNVEDHKIATTAHTKAQVGLGNVDNTSDSLKPVSTAQDTRFTAVEATANAAAPQVSTYSKVDIDTKTIDLQTQVNSRLSKVASSVLLNSDSVSLANTLVTKNFAEVTYTGNGATQSITTGINSVDFTVANNGSGYWLDRTVNQVKDDAGTVVASGTTDWGINKGVSKVHIKNRTTAVSNAVVDGLRGRDFAIQTDTTSVDITGAGSFIVSFDTSGITVGTNNMFNTNTDTYILYQTLYTHIKWFSNSMGALTVVAFNPVTQEYMGYVVESSNAGAEIDLTGIVSDSVVVEYKQLGSATDWQVDALGNKLVLNTNAAAV